MRSNAAVPELPEVEFGRKVAEACAQDRCIRSVHCADDAIVFQGRGASEVEGLLAGRTVKGVKRWGKYLWFELDRVPWPVFHFGMTGSFRVPQGQVLKLAASPRREPTSWPPRFTKIHFHFDDGGELVMTNARRLGRITLHEDPRAEAPIAALGFDPLLEMPSLEAFSRLLSRRKGTLKGVLLDQSFAAGVGNWIADEVLYQARLDPRRKVPSLDGAERESLHRALESVIAEAVAVDARKKDFPAWWLFHRRWGRDGFEETVEGEAIERIEVAGRSTAWVPSRQR